MHYIGKSLVYKSTVSSLRGKTFEKAESANKFKCSLDAYEQGSYYFLSQPIFSGKFHYSSYCVNSATLVSTVYLLFIECIQCLLSTLTDQLSHNLINYLAYIVEQIDHITGLDSSIPNL